MRAISSFRNSAQTSTFRKWLNLISGMIRSAIGDPEAWEASIREFERIDSLQPPVPGGILFMGSSTFTFWSSMKHDIGLLRTINRGFGGSKIADMSLYFDRVVIPHMPKAIVLFAGTNDIAGRKPGTANDVYQGYLRFVQQAKHALPQTHVYYVAITPTPSRWKYWSTASEANRLIFEYTKQDSMLHFVDPTLKFLGTDNMPDRRLFKRDRLHPNEKGYAILAQSIGSMLEANSF